LLISYLWVAVVEVDGGVGGVAEEGYVYPGDESSLCGIAFDFMGEFGALFVGEDEVVSIVLCIGSKVCIVLN